MMEVEGHREFPLLRAGVTDALFKRSRGHFSNRDHFMRAKYLIIHRSDEFMDTWTICVEFPSISRRHTSVIIREALVLGDQVNHIHAEAVHTLAGPEQHHLIDLSANLLILPVQICLCLIEKGKIILA